MNTTIVKTNDFRLPSVFVLGKRIIQTYKDWRLDRIILQAKKDDAEGKTLPMNTSEDFRRLLD